MAASALLTNASTNGPGAVVQVSGGAGCNIEIPGDSVMDGATVIVQASSVNNQSKFSPVGYKGRFDAPGVVDYAVADGMYVQALVAGAGPNTRVNCNLIDGS